METIGSTWMWVGFAVTVLAMIAIDLFVVGGGKAHRVTMREAAAWSVVWITVAFAFAGVLWWYVEASAGRAVANATTLEFVTGYLIEKSLSMDNVFVIALIFAFFAIPGKYQHRVLFWGILGALVLRGIMIYLGAKLVLRYSWVLIIFGLFLVLTALKMALIKGHSDPGQNIVVRLTRKFIPSVDFFDGQKFFTRRSVAPTYSRDPVTGHERQDPAPPGSLRPTLAVTPLFLALVMVEFTDLVFAVDSIPAIFAITTDPFIVMTSNIFAILGLRALYFALAAMIHRFHYLKTALALVLVFIGSKVFAADLLGIDKVPPVVSLAVTLGLLAGGVIYSLWKTRRQDQAANGAA